MLWTEYRPVIKIGPKGTLGSHKIHPIHSAPSLGQSIGTVTGCDCDSDGLLTSSTISHAFGAQYTIVVFFSTGPSGVESFSYGQNFFKVDSTPPVSMKNS